MFTLANDRYDTFSSFSFYKQYFAHCNDIIIKAYISRHLYKHKIYKYSSKIFVHTTKLSHIDRYYQKRFSNDNKIKIILLDKINNKVYARTLSRTRLH